MFSMLSSGYLENNLCAHGNCRTLYEEIDYINEGKNADKFRRDFRNVKWVRVPVCSC